MTLVFYQILKNPEEIALFNSIKSRLAESPNWYSERLDKILGVTEETQPVYKDSIRCLRMVI